MAPQASRVSARRHGSLHGSIRQGAAGDLHTILKHARLTCKPIRALRYRMQHGIGTPRERRAWQEAVRTALERGDRLIAQLAAKGVAPGRSRRPVASRAKPVPDVARSFPGGEGGYIYPAPGHSATMDAAAAPAAREAAR